MAYEIINTKRSKSVIRITGNTATRINLSQLSTNTTTELISSATLAYISGSTDGVWSVYRGNDNTGEKVISLFGNKEYPLAQYDIVIANNSTSNLYFTNSGSDGTLIVSISKEATYTVDPDTGRAII